MRSVRRTHFLDDGPYTMSKPQPGSDPSPDSNRQAFPVLPGERGIRFVFGAVVGAGLGALAGMNFLGMTSRTSLALSTILTAIVCGALAAALGDRFWKERWWLWFWR
jgi:hypothetical protein